MGFWVAAVVHQCPDILQMKHYCPTRRLFRQSETYRRLALLYCRRCPVSDQIQAYGWYSSLSVRASECDLFCVYVRAHLYTHSVAQATVSVPNEPTHVEAEGEEASS